MKTQRNIPQDFYARFDEEWTVVEKYDISIIFHRTGNQTLGGHKQNLVCTRTQKKGAVTPQETEPDLPVSVQESLVEAWVDSGLLQGRGTEYNSAGISPFEGGCHYSYHSLASGQTTGREHRPEHQQEIGLKIYLTWSCPSE